VHDHREILALAAAAIDFELDPAERSRLDAALATCSLCRRQASAMRATATVLRRPSDIGTPSRVRDVVVGAAMRGGRRSPRFGPLAVASLSLLAVLGGTAVIVGSRGFGIVEPVSSPSPVPVQSASAAATATPVPTPEPDPTPTPSPTTAVVPPSATQDGPLQAGDIAAMVTDGRLVIRTLPQATADSAIFKTKLYPGQRVLILEGPVEGSGYPWFRVRLGAIEGWMAASARDGEPWLAPVRNGVIALVRENSDGSGEAIYTRTPDATAGEALMFSDPDLFDYGQLTWSPDGRRLAFVATTAESLNPSSEIFVVDADGSNLVRITVNGVDDDSPAWSPDGTRLALRVAQQEPAALGDTNVVVTPVDGPGVTVLGPGADPVWSPDGLLVSVAVSTGGSTTLWVQAPDGADRRQVSDIAIASTRPAWSPDGQSLVVSSSGLYIIDVASGAATPLVTDPGLSPDWSAAGIVAFTTTGSASPGAFVVAADGTGLKRMPGESTIASAAAWSPDGRQLVLGSEATGAPITIVDISGDNQIVIAAIDDLGRSPAWQPRLP
jgi:Tol biopolymer transport system component